MATVCLQAELFSFIIRNLETGGFSRVTTYLGITTSGSNGTRYFSACLNKTCLDYGFD